MTDYKKKYLKYKKKYVDLNELLNQTGGRGGAGDKYWYDDPKFEEINTINKSELFVNNYQIRRYHDMLDKLLLKENKYGPISDDEEKVLINLDFINEFYKNIYYSTSDDNSFAISINDTRENTREPLNDTILNFTKPIELDMYSVNYEKTRIIYNDPINKFSGIKVIIIFLNNSDPTQFKVLIIFANENINCMRIKQYLSLEIMKIVNKNFLESGLNNLQENYTEINQNFFNSLNFNCISKFIQDQNGDNILLSINTKDAINDFINNIIIQKINIDNERINGDNRHEVKLVKYFNLFTMPVTIAKCNLASMLKLCEAFTTENYYCILMEEKVESVSSLIKRGISQNILYKMLEDVDRSLDILKSPEHLFTHTDCKLENIFYDMITDFNQYNFYLADFDKSSITYNGIRFYNSLKNQGFFKAWGDIIKGKPGSGLDNYTINSTILRISNYHENTEPFNYRISTILKDLKGYINIEQEQAYMRYSPIPYYTSFDMVSLILSCFLIKNIQGSIYILQDDYFTDGIKSVLIINKYIPIKTQRLLLTRRPSWQTNYDGDFGKLLLFLTADLELYQLFEFNHYFNNMYKRFNQRINQLIITNTNKIALSPIFIGNTISSTIIVREVEKTISTVVVSRRTLDKYNYDQLYFDIMFINIQIIFDGARFHNPNASIIDIGLDNIVKTNMYSKTLLVKYLYEWDYVCDDLEKIIPFFKAIQNNIRVTASLIDFSMAECKSNVECEVKGEIDESRDSDDWNLVNVNPEPEEFINISTKASNDSKNP